MSELFVGNYFDNYTLAPVTDKDLTWYFTQLYQYINAHINAPYN